MGTLNACCLCHHGGEQYLALLTAASTRMVRVFGGYPKFSKSIPGSAIDMTTSPTEVRRLLIDEPPRPTRRPPTQLMCQMPAYDAATLFELHARCREGRRTWRREVDCFTDYLVDLIDRWLQ